MPIDTREIRSGRARLFELITSDRPCGKCRYNLKGLPSNGRCPECGTPIARAGRAHRFSDNLADAPLFYLKTLALGACLIAILSVVCSYAFFFLEEGPTIIKVAVAGAASLAWWIGVFIVTGPRQLSEYTLRDSVLDAPWLRWINRALQAAWMLAVVAWFLSLRSGPPVNAIAVHAARALEIVGVFGLVPLAVHLASLADWGGASGLADRFRVSAWALAFFGIISEAGRFTTGFKQGVTPSVWGGLLYLNATWATFVVSITQVAFLICLIHLAHMTVWAIFNSSKASDVNRRLLDKRLEHEREMARRTAIAGALTTPPNMPQPGRLPPKPRIPRT